ncbi:unnamed protein product, partial [Staurois parvus]
MSPLKCLNFHWLRPPYVPYVPTLTGTRTWKTDASVGPRRWPGAAGGT